MDILSSKRVFPLLRLLLSNLSLLHLEVLLDAGEVGTMLVTQHTTPPAQAEKPQFLSADLSTCKSPLSETSCYAHPALHSYSHLAQSQSPEYKCSQCFRLIKLEMSSDL